VIKKIDSLVEHFLAEEPLILLESQSKNHKASHFTYLAARPNAAIKAYGDQIEVTEGKVKSFFTANPWQALKEFREKYKSFIVGYLGYDLKNYTQKLTSCNEDKVAAHDMFFMVPTVLLKIDNQKEEISVLKGRMPDIKPRTSAADNVKISMIHSSISRKDYFSAVKQIKYDIDEGKYDELNFTHQLHARFSGSCYGLYQKMRKNGPVPFGAFIKVDDLKICSFSPERFLRKKGRCLISQPIKGTIKRTGIMAEDKVLKARLQSSLKERNENQLAVELVCFDLNRVSRPGSVQVERLYEIQSFNTVHQMVSTISGFAETAEPVDIVKSCFPMGSMTGAPKVKAMRAIEEYENYKRGVYSGAIGFITPDGDFDFNAVIRTAIIKKNDLYYSAGGAITAGSDPEDEWQESWLKAERLKQIIK